MKLNEFLEYVSKPSYYRSEIYTEDDIKGMLTEKSNYGRSRMLQFLFVNEKTIHEPSKEVKALQDRMRELGADEEFLLEMSSKLQYYDFDLPIPLQEAFEEAFRHREIFKDTPEKNSSLESWYSIESA